MKEQRHHGRRFEDRRSTATGFPELLGAGSSGHTTQVEQTPTWACPQGRIEQNDRLVVNCRCKSFINQCSTEEDGFKILV